jgi:hypothetical protein
MRVAHERLNRSSLLRGVCGRRDGRPRPRSANRSRPTNSRRVGGHAQGSVPIEDRGFLRGVVLSGAEGDRTPDLCIANAALSQLSYGPGRAGKVAAWERLSIDSMGGG